jgi:dihydroorotase
MKLLLKNVRPYQAGAQTLDILVHDGLIARMEPNIQADDSVEMRDFNGAFVSPGWMDVGPQCGDPGYEHREDLFSAAAAAAAGGFTALASAPNTHPAVHSKSEVLYIRHKTAGLTTQFFPLGAISHNLEGKDLAELMDMREAGAVAFTDGDKPVQDAGLLLRALLYAKAFGGLIFNTPHHKSVAAGGQMHEGRVSAMLGMPGIPAIAETLMVQRDLSLLEYADSRLHLHLISTAESVELIRQAKAKGLHITCSVALLNLCFTDDPETRGLGLRMEDGFDTSWKVKPPLRSEKDRFALLEGLRDGTIDFISTQHSPWDEEAKNLEFPYAEFGVTMLETAYAVYNAFLSAEMPLELWVEKIALAPRRVLGLPAPELKIGAPAELSIFDPQATWTYARGKMRSKSFNSPFLGREMKGKVLGVLNGGKAIWH